MKTLKTALSFLLVFCMMTSVCGLAAFADVNVVTPGEGTGTQLGILEGSATISYTDSSGGPHVPPVPGVPHVPPVPGVPALDPGVPESIVPALDPGVPESIAPDLGSGVPSSNPGSVENNYNTGDVLTANTDSGSSAPAAGAPASAAPAAATDTGSGVSAAIPDPVPTGTTVEVNPAGNSVTRNNGTIGCVDESGTPVEGTGNYGFIGVNYGTVTSNNAGGTLDTNLGLLISNEEGATVNVNTTGSRIVNNAGTVIDNPYGTIETNTGTVENNSNSGVVTENYGEVTLYGSKVVDNYGDVTSYGGGSVENNYGGNVTIYGYGSITHDYYGVRVETDAADYDFDGSIGGVEKGNGYYLEKTAENNTKGEGTISVRITPTADVETPVVDAKVNTDEFNMSRDETGWTFSFKNLIGNILLKITRKSEPEPKPEPEPQPDPKPDPKPVSAPAVDLSINAVKFTFDLDGGSLKGETGKVIKWYIPGATVKLPAAPTKDGFTFAGWETTVKGEKVVLQPGEEFTVTGAQSFTALWEEA